MKKKNIAIAMALAFSLAGCVSNAPQKEAGSPSTQTKANNTGDSVQDVNQKVNKLTNAKPMTGRELIEQLRTLRSGFASGNPKQALNNFLTSASQPAKNVAGKNGVAANAQNADPLAGLFNSGNGGSFSSVLSDMALDALVSNLSYSAIDGLFEQIMEDKDVLNKVTVDVPDVSKQSPALRKQVLNLSAYLVAIKASGMLIDSSQNEFSAAKNSYLRAIDLRRKAVEVLGEALFATSGLEATQREDKKRGTNLLNDPQYQTLLSAFNNKRPEELMGDFALQNLALEYAKKSRPELFKDYQLEVREVKSHYGAYVKTLTGTSSMLGFGALFLKRAKNLLEKEQVAGATVLLPLATQGLTELASLAPRIKKTFDSGDDLSEGSFKIVAEDQNALLKSKLTAKKAFSALDGEATTALKSNLISQRGNGLLMSLYNTNHRTAGALIDHVISKDARNALIKDGLELTDATDFSFQNAYDGKISLDKNKKNFLTRDLLAYPLKSDNRDAGDQSLAKVQEELLNNLGQYSNSDLRKLMFVVPKQDLLNPSLKLGKIAIQIDALGVAGLAEYDEVFAGSLKQSTIRSYASEKAASKGKGEM